MTDRRRGVHCRLFRLLLWGYPRAFRKRYGLEMEELFAERLKRRRSRGRGAVAGLWLRILADAAVGGFAEHGSEWRQRRVNGGFERGRSGVLDRLRQDLVVSVRRLARAPVFTLAAVSIAALGIGANTAVFTLVDALLFRPAPFADADRVVRIYQDSDDGDPNSSSYPATRDMREYSDVFSGVAAWSPDVATWESPDGPRSLATEYVTSDYLNVLGLSPSMGRFFEPVHDEPGAGVYAVLTRLAWETKFGADPDIVGRTIRLNGQPATVLGIGPRSFYGSGGALVTDAWLSISSTVIGGPFRVQNLERRQDHWYQTWARLAPGVTLMQAQAAMDALAARLAETYPEMNEGRGITVFRAGDIRLHPGADGAIRASGLTLLGVVGLVLLLACSNLAGLLLVRGMSRSSEVAVRRALGASSGRVAKLLLTEAMILSVAGGAVGLLIARWLTTLVPGLPIALPVGAALQLDIDIRVLVFTGILVAVTGVLFGLAPAIRSASADIAGTLRKDVRFASHGKRVPFLRNALVSIQVAISLMLLVGSGLLVRSLAALSSMDAGVAADEVAYVALNGGQAGLDAQQSAVAVDAVRRAFESIPGVRSVALSSRLPVLDRGGSTTTIVEGYQPPAGTEAVELLLAFVTPEYFETVGIPLLGGRGFTEADVTSGIPITIVNETAAIRFWGTTDPAGHRMRPQASPDAWSDVVGVVADSKVRTLGEPGTPLIYRPLPSAGATTVYLLARASGDATPLVPAMRNVLREVSPELLNLETGTLDTHIRSGLASPRTATIALAGFAVLAMILTGLGIYAVLSFTVARRSAELGIRMALGAERGGVIRAVVTEVLVTVIVGLVAGFTLSALVATRIEGLLFGIDGVDPAAFGTAVAALLLVAALAAWVPARRAVGIDPVDALRVKS